MNQILLRLELEVQYLLRNRSAENMSINEYVNKRKTLRGILAPECHKVPVVLEFREFSCHLNSSVVYA